MNKIIAVDFDGTLCKDAWPEIGTPNQFLIQYLIHMKAGGTKLILWTCRSGETLSQAITWCLDHGLIFDAVNKNLPEAIERFGGDSRKIFADIYIDDKAVNWAVD